MLAIHDRVSVPTADVHRPDGSPMSSQLSAGRRFVQVRQHLCERAVSRPIGQLSTHLPQSVEQPAFKFTKSASLFDGTGDKVVELLHGVRDVGCLVGSTVFRPQRVLRL